MFLSFSDFLKKLSYELKKDPIYKIINSAIAKIQEGNFTQADGFLKSGLRNMENKHKYYAHLTGVKESFTAYKKALDLIRAKDSSGIIENLKAVLENLEKAAPEIHKEQLLPTLAR